MSLVKFVMPCIILKKMQFKDEDIQVDLFKSPSEKRHELTKIRQCECSEVQDWERERTLRSPILEDSLLDFAALVLTYYR